MKPYTAGALVLPFLISFSAAQAAPPDAGQLLREQQPQRQMPRQLPTPETEKERSPLSDSGVRVAVKGFTFSGIEGLATESELQALVADAVGKSLSFSELQSLAAKVTAHLKDKGWFLAKAYLPKQDITSGVIEIAVIQGKSDGLIIRRDKSARISEESISSIAQKSVRHGQPINNASNVPRSSSTTFPASRPRHPWPRGAPPAQPPSSSTSVKDRSSPAQSGATTRATAIPGPGAAPACSASTTPCGTATSSPC